MAYDEKCEPAALMESLDMGLIGTAKCRNPSVLVESLEVVQKCVHFPRICQMFKSFPECDGEDVLVGSNVLRWNQKVQKKVQLSALTLQFSCGVSLSRAKNVLMCS